MRPAARALLRQPPAQHLVRGYWSWEAAAITCVLDIDDSGYRGAPFYPADLVAFCSRQGEGSGA